MYMRSRPVVIARAHTANFHGRPTRGDCEGLEAMRIDEGYFGDIRLDGLLFAAILVDRPALSMRNVALAALAAATISSSPALGRP